MKILLVNPKNPPTFWNFRYALKFVPQKASFPPLSLMTVAAMLPSHYEVKLVDMNVRRLKNKDILWADYVFLTAISVQQESVKEIIKRCKNLGAKIVAGGPHFTKNYKSITGVDHFVLGEAETIMQTFLEDLEAGKAKYIYKAESLPDLSLTPTPIWQLSKRKQYVSMSVQYSRGCPFNCEFCDITVLYGRKVRTKGKDQIIAELQSLYDWGWRGPVFFVDDNFIGNKKKLKQEVLPAIITWMQEHNNPFTFNTEVSINLSDDDELIEMMVKAGFNTVFVGIESPNEDSLAECNKYQNKNRDLIACINKLHRMGLEVQGGFIVGFDSDPPSIFDRVIDFVQKSKIVTAMVGLLNAPIGTRLYQRLSKEGRMKDGFTGVNTDLSINFIPKMDYKKLIEGYKKIVNTIYSPKYYYKRVKQFLKEFNPLAEGKRKITFRDIKAFLKSVIRLGIIGRERVQYWKLFFWSLFRSPRKLPYAVRLSILGFHFRKIFKKLR